MDFAQAIRNCRLRFGMTQQQVAFASGVSLANLQKIEAGKANPSLSTVEALLQVFDLDLEIRVPPVDWNILAQLGVPLLNQSKTDLQIKKNPRNLAKYLKSASQKVVAGGESIPERNIEALQSMLVAIRTHYPKFFRKNLESQKSIKQLYPKEISGRLLKLRRLSLAVISEYL